MHDRFAELLAQPTARRYKQLRKQLLAPRESGPFSLQLAEVQRALECDDLNTAAQLLSDLLPAGLLSVRLHRLGGALEIARGDLRRAELHRLAYDAIVAAIAHTGTGTRREPLLITYASDASEVLAARGLTVQSQSLIVAGQRHFDVLLTDDEREFWFDVSDLLPVPAALPARSKKVATHAVGT